ncbi:MAG TPA: DUF995 domain-containing protein [Thermohalobaculum sp.]|nr:DUF995 domain-containing protein [Thermohalobaculum sp.]
MTRPLAIAAALAALALPAAAQERTPLTGAELTALLSGNTETWATLGAGYYDPGGAMAYVWEGKPGAGEWSVTEEGILCLRITAWYGPDFNCGWTYFREGGEIYSLNLKTDKATRMPGYAPGKTFE